jgi:hypothetical protein
MMRGPETPDHHQHLDPDQITRTCSSLTQRIAERFPKAGLASVARQVVRSSEDAARLIGWLDRPIPWTRGPLAGTTVLALIVVGAMLANVNWRASAYSSLADLLQGFDAVVNELILLGAAIFFLSSLETRIKRRRALDALHGLRSLAHIVDMHQLTKDPARLLARGSATPSSPKRDLSAYELTRYLGYSSELLSLLSKIAALHVQKFNDPVTLAAVDELEGLCASLSGKMWQKILIVDRGAANGHGR